MKKTFLALTILTFAVLPFVAAQEEEEKEEPSAQDLGLRATDPVGRTEPSVTIPSERSNSDYPKPGTPLNTPTPSTAASPSPSPANSSTKAASAAKKASPTPSPTPAAAARASATPTPAPKGNVAAVIKESENRWAAAIAAHDTTVPQALVADNYIGVDSSGSVVNKAALIAGMKRDKNTYDSAVNSAMTVRIHGNAAVIVGTTKQAGKDKDGKAFNYTYRWTDTWVERNGQWQCVGSQSFLVAR